MFKKKDYILSTIMSAFLLFVPPTLFVPVIAKLGIYTIALLPVLYIFYLFTLTAITVPLYRILPKDDFFLTASALIGFTGSMYEKMPGLGHVFYAIMPLYGLKKGRSYCNGVILNPENIEIGNNVFIGRNAAITSHVIEKGIIKFKKVRIGNNVTIGANAVILPGAVIEDNAVIGANAVVGKDKIIKDGEVYTNKR